MGNQLKEFKLNIYFFFFWGGVIPPAKRVFPNLWGIILTWIYAFHHSKMYFANKRRALWNRFYSSRKQRLILEIFAGLRNRECFYYSAIFLSLSSREISLFFPE